MMKTIAQAHRLVKEVKVCTIFPSDKVEHTSLWEHVDLPDKQPGESGWGQKMSAVWTWKTRLPAESLNRLAQYISDKVSEEPGDTTTLRNTVMEEFGCTKSQFAGTLKNLQITMNIVI